MPTPTELLENLFPLIEEKLIPELAEGSSAKYEISKQLRLFFDLMKEGIQTKNFEIFDPLITSWANDLTQSDLEDETIITKTIINKIIDQTHLTIQETLPPPDANKIQKVLVPFVDYLLSQSARLENEIKITYLQRELSKARSELRKFDQSKSDFVAVAAHELKTPLTLIDGYTNMLIDLILQRDLKDLLIHANGILNGSKRLRSIIDDMLDVSLIDNGLFILNEQAFWLNRIIEFVLLELTPICKERKIELSVDQFSGFNEMNFGDSERLIQLFRNILTNAIKFTPDGGKIKISGRKLTGFIEITINDTGIGIDSDDQVLIFEKFSRLGNVALHSSGKTKFKGGGPGLGLPIAKGIAEAHGGSIWVESPGYSETEFPGTTFHILLPIKETIS